MRLGFDDALDFLAVFSFVIIDVLSISPDAIHAEIGEVLADAKSARIGVDAITLYKSVGIAIQDVAAAALVYRKASQLGVGTNAEI
jgi:alanine dehydrogenase